jgi:hypothetical protein
MTQRALALTNAQLAAVTTAAASLPSSERSDFLIGISRRLGEMPTTEAVEHAISLQLKQYRRLFVTKQAGCSSTDQGRREATSYAITSSALTISDCGKVIPSTFAVLRLRTSLNLVGCSTGRSAGFAPFSILST